MSAVIAVDDLSKTYRLGVLGGGSLRADVSRWWAKLRGRPDPLRRIGERHDARLEGQTFWALRNVSFEVRQGEVLAIIGRNGAGKSTLLKILSRVTGPTEGRIRLRGRVASLLEVGTGFHQELTGRENVFLNGAILGMTKGEIRRKFDEIVAFAEIAEFIDTPVKRYSSGMFVRLAFAVAAHLEPEILIVDEVLAVGDAAFQRKCLGKMQDVAGHGRTVLFVSHNMSAVRTLCPHAVVLDEGRLRFQGGTAEAIRLYSEQGCSPENTVWVREGEPAAGPVQFRSVRAVLAGEAPGQRLECELELEARSGARASFVAVDVCDTASTAIMQALPKAEPFIPGEPGAHRVRLTIDLPPLVPGRYSLDFWVGPHFSQTYDLVRGVLAFEITRSPSPDRSFPHTADHDGSCRFPGIVTSPPRRPGSPPPHPLHEPFPRWRTIPRPRDRRHRASTLPCWRATLRRRRREGSLPCRRGRSRALRRGS